MSFNRNLTKERIDANQSARIRRCIDGGGGDLAGTDESFRDPDWKYPGDDRCEQEWSAHYSDDFWRLYGAGDDPGVGRSLDRQKIRQCDYQRSHSASGESF